MELDKEVHVKQVLKRFPPGDRWTPAEATQILLSNIHDPTKGLVQLDPRLYSGWGFLPFQ